MEEGSIEQGIPTQCNRLQVEPDIQVDRSDDISARERARLIDKGEYKGRGEMHVVSQECQDAWQVESELYTHCNVGTMPWEGTGFAMGCTAPDEAAASEAGVASGLLRPADLGSDGVGRGGREKP